MKSIYYKILIPLLMLFLISCSSPSLSRDDLVGLWMLDTENSPGVKEAEGLDDKSVLRDIKFNAGGIFFNSDQSFEYVERKTCVINEVNVEGGVDCEGIDMTLELKSDSFVIDLEGFELHYVKSPNQP